MKNLKLILASADDAPELAALHVAVAERLTREYGKGHWSSATSEKGVINAMRTSRVFVARQGKNIIATLQLATKKPWAIDKSYFAECKRPLYLTNMAVEPSIQKTGIGRLCMKEARRIAREWPGDAIRLDAYDAVAGAGGFYEKCGFTEIGRVTYRRVPLIYYELLL